MFDKIINGSSKPGMRFLDGLAQAFGISPITRLRTAQFLSAHVPGIYVPQNWVDELASAAKISEEEEQKVGMELSLNLFNSIKNFHPKIHLMTANKFEIAAELLA